MFIILCAIIFGQLGMINSSDHAIYLSTLEINISETKSDVVIKVFENDLRDALRAHFNRRIDTTSQVFEIDVNAYLNAHLSIIFDNKKVTPFVSKVELVGESYQVFMLMEHVRPYQKIEINADYFMELFPTQQNVLHISNNGKKQYYIFKKGNEKYKIFIES